MTLGPKHSAQHFRSIPQGRHFNTGTEHMRMQSSGIFTLSLSAKNSMLILFFEILMIKDLSNILPKILILTVILIPPST